MFGFVSILRKLLIPVTIAVVIGLFLFRTTVFLDSDFGWHLKTGQIILQSGIPKIDPFTYSMPSFPYVDLSWLTDTITAKIFPIVGLQGLGIISAMIVLTTFGINLLTAKKGWKLLATPFLLLSSTAILPFSSVRSLIMSWLIFSVFLWIFSDDKRWEKWKFPSIIIFLIGVNLHGGFVSYLALLIFFLFCRFIKRTILLSDIAVGLAFFAVTLVNPYGLGLWREVLSTVASPVLKTNIVEWKSILEWFNPSALTIEVTALIFSIKYVRKFSLFNLLIFWFFLASAVMAIRNIPFAIFCSLPLLFSGSQYLFETAKDKTRFSVARNVFTTVAIIICVVQVIILIPEILRFREDVFYPKSTVEYLQKHPRNGQIFSHYDWGGYLIWKMPEKKVFIDGRMPVWIWTPQDKNESLDAFKDYLGILSGKTDFMAVFSKFNVKTVLWPEGNNLDFIARLKKSGWQKIYEDQTAVVYVLK